MSLTPSQARDEIFAVLKAAWDPTGYIMHWQDVRAQRDTDQDPFAAAFIQHADGFQSTLVGSVGSREFTRLGFVTVQIFTPAGQGLQETYELAKVVSDAFEGISTPGGVWFRNVRLNEVGQDGEFYQLNVIANFRYTETR